MRFVPCGVEELGKLKKYGDNHGILTKFVESGLPVARVEDYPQKSADICQTSMTASIKRYGFKVRVLTRKGKVYFVRTDI